MDTDSRELITSSDAKDDSVRLFIALPLPAPIKAAVAEVQSRLKKGFMFAACRPAWTNPETLHVTLRFLGQTPTSLVPAIDAAIAAVSERYSPLEIKAHDMGAFPNWRDPRALWTGLSEKTGQLESLQRGIEEAMQALGFKAEQRKFAPHMTLARFKSKRGTAAARSIVASHRNFKTGWEPMDEIALFKSEPTKDGSRHFRLSTTRIGLKEPAREDGENLQSLSSQQKDA